MEKIKFSVSFLLLILLLKACHNKNPEEGSVIYESKEYTMYGDRIVQDKFEAKALSRTHITSNYVSPARSDYSSLITFKFSINGKDNEAPSGQDHQLLIKPEEGKFISPVLVFGEKEPQSYSEGQVESLPPNTEVTIRLDMRPVLKQFEEKGFYIDYAGEKITKQDFKGVYIAGGSEPLSWDFDNLANNPDYKLTDEDNDGIYKGIFVLNPHDPNENAEKEWKLANDISRYPSYVSEQVLVDALYNLSLDETMMLIEDDGTFRTGAKWEGVWTRDVSYSILLAYAFLEPEISKTSLMRKVKRDRIIQDTGSGGAWPVSSDRIVWALAAWEIYKATGDDEWLRNSYKIIKNSIEDDLETVFDKETGLFKGESSFLDWREQTYPIWMDNVDISQSLNLGTNAAYFQTLQILSEMAGLMKNGEEADLFSQKAEDLKTAINKHLWNNEMGYYNQYLYGRHFMNTSPRAEALGEAFTVLFGIADRKASAEVVKNMPVSPFGISCIYPQIPNIPPYHNNGIWPFVQAYWNWAAKEAGNEKALVHGLASLYRPAALFLTNKENFVAENGDFLGTQINSDRQLWSVAGNLAMVFRVYLGMEFQKDKLVFDPFVPEVFAGTKKIEGFKYRNAVLDFQIEGFGNEIEAFMIDGQKKEEYSIPADLQGPHEVKIRLRNRGEKGEYKLVENRFSLPHPVAKVSEGVLTWDSLAEAATYRIYKDGEQVAEISDNRYALPENEFGQYKVLAIGNDGFESFTSEPVQWYSPGQVKKLEVENYASASPEKLIDFSGSGFVEITRNKNTDIEIPLQIAESGTYLISFRYSNGSGPWNTDNKCAIRTLKVDGEKAGTVVMAQRGKDEWSNWGFSNPIPAALEKGNHTLQLVWEASNENMNVEVNRAMLDHLQLVKIR